MPPLELILILKSGHLWRSLHHLTECWQKRWVNSSLFIYYSILLWVCLCMQSKIINDLQSVMDTFLALVGCDLLGLSCLSPSAGNCAQWADAWRDQKHHHSPSDLHAENAGVSQLHQNRSDLTLYHPLIMLYAWSQHNVQIFFCAVCRLFWRRSIRRLWTGEWWMKVMKVHMNSM